MSNAEDTDSATYFKEFADAAGLKERDMPSSHHPLLENDEPVEQLSDLIRVRENPSRDPMNAAGLGADDPDLDIQEALTFPHKKHQTTSAERIPAISDFDADARTPSPPDDADDASYMGRADVEQSMLDTDPDPNAGAERDDFIGDARIDRAPDMTGTVQGIGRGTSTHLPQDIGASGFQIEEPEELEDSLVTSEVPHPDPADNDGDVLPVNTPNVNSRDDALDATRTLR